MDLLYIGPYGSRNGGTPFAVLAVRSGNPAPAFAAGILVTVGGMGIGLVALHDVIFAS